MNQLLVVFALLSAFALYGQAGRCPRPMPQCDNFECLVCNDMTPGNTIAPLDPLSDDVDLYASFVDALIECDNPGAWFPRPTVYTQGTSALKFEDGPVNPAFTEFPGICPEFQSQVFNGWDFSNWQFNVNQWRDTFSCGEKGVFRASMSVSFQSPGVENHPFNNDGTIRVVNPKDDYRLASFAFVVLDGERLKSRGGTFLSSGFFITEEGIWITNSRQHFVNAVAPTDPDTNNHRGLINQVRRIRSKTATEIVDMAVEYDCKCNQWRWYLEGELVETVYDNELATELNRDGWFTAFSNRIELAPSFVGKRITSLTSFWGMAGWPYFAHPSTGKGLIETWLWEHMDAPGIGTYPLTFPDPSKGEFEYTSKYTNELQPAEFWNWGQNVTSTIYDRKIQRAEHSCACCKRRTNDDNDDNDDSGRRH